MMKAAIQKWGNSLALRLPKALADEAQLGEGAKVELVRTPDGVRVKGRRRKPRYRLSDLLAAVTPTTFIRKRTEVLLSAVRWLNEAARPGRPGLD